MGSIARACAFFSTRSIEDTARATFGSYGTLIGLSVLCAAVAILQLYRLPANPSWKMHRKFLLFTLLGCCISAVNAIFRMNQVYYGIAATSLPEDQVLHYEYIALSRTYGAWFYITYPWETACLMFAKLMVLERMGSFAVRGTVASSQLRQWLRWNSRQLFLAAILLCNVICICAYSAGASYYFQDSELNSQVSMTNISDPSVRSAYEIKSVAYYTSSSMCLSVQGFSESLMFLIVVISFCVVGLHVKKRIASMLDKLSTVRGSAVVQNAHTTGRAIDRRVRIAVAFIFMSFILRFIWTFVNAVANQFPENPACGFCSDCQSGGFILSATLFYGGEVRSVVWMFSNPLALLVSIIFMHPISPKEQSSFISAPLMPAAHHGSAAAGGHISFCNASP